MKVCANLLQSAASRSPPPAGMNRNAACGAPKKSKLRSIDSARAAVSCRPTPCARSEEHKSEIQSLMRSSYAVFCLKKKHSTHYIHINQHSRKQYKKK